MVNVQEQVNIADEEAGQAALWQQARFFYICPSMAKTHTIASLVIGVVIGEVLS